MTQQHRSFPARTLSNVLILLIIAIIVPASATDTNGYSYGGDEDVAFAERLWDALAEERLVGDNVLDSSPYPGMHPHGAVLEVLTGTVTIDNREAKVITKRSYTGDDADVVTVINNRLRFLNDVTVMFKREAGYDSENKDWFWAKYNIDGSLDATPNGIKLAGRIAKGKRKGCIACHRRAEGDDFMFVE